MPAGRPTKLTDAVQDKILKAILGGNYREVAAQWAGIDKRTLGRWLQIGQTRPNSAYATFRRLLLEAEQEAEIRSVARLMRATENDPNHIKWWLERKFPDRWGRRDHMTVASEKELPILVVRQRGK